MSRPILFCRSALLLGFLPTVTLKAQDRRAFESGGPASLIWAGNTNVTRMEEQTVTTGFSFTTDRNGRVISAGGDTRKETVEVVLFSVYLYVDSAGTAAALRQFAGADWYELVNQGKIQDALLQGAFPMSLVFRFIKPVNARLVRNGIVEAIHTYPSGAGAEAGTLTGYFRGDFKAQDEVEIRILPGGTLKTSVRGEAKPDLVSAEFADSFLRAWLLKSRPLVARLRTLVPPKPGP